MKKERKINYIELVLQGLNYGFVILAVGTLVYTFIDMTHTTDMLLFITMFILFAVYLRVLRHCRLVEKHFKDATEVIND